jgi:hypothetical protein
VSLGSGMAAEDALTVASSPGVALRALRPLIQ